MFRIFYSWISDRPAESHRMVVYRALVAATQQAADGLGVPREQAEVLQCERFDTPTDIARFIVETIPTCHALVGDISFINVAGEHQTRRTPNPNTMFEIGLATQCLGPGKVILVFNTDDGSTVDLPFDIRNHAMITWSGSNPSTKLAHDLQGPVEGVFRSYHVLATRLAHELGRCFGSLLEFLEGFMLRHVQDPRFTEETMALFHPNPDEEAVYPQGEYVAQVLRAYHGQILAAPSTLAGVTEGNVFAIHLQRLHHDCERLAYRYRELGGSDMFRRLERVGIEAGHLERLIGRVNNRVPSLLVDDIIVDEILRFLREVVEARRQAARYAGRHLGQPGPASERQQGPGLS
jgi:hypothetical protein